MTDTLASYTLTVQLNKKTGDHYVVLPDALIKKLKWKTGDVLSWTDNGNGTYTLSKLEKQKKTK